MLTPKELDDQIDQFEESLRKLKIQYDLFFANVRKVPPSFERARLEALVHELSRERIRDNARRFRFNTLMGRFNQFRELWGRRMREREEGPTDFRRRQSALDAPPEERKRPEISTSPRETSSVPLSYVRVAPSGDGESIRELYSQFANESQKAGKQTGLTLEQVSAMVQKQAEALRARYGVNTIAFRFENVDGKVKLKARPVNETT